MSVCSEFIKIGLWNFKPNFGPEFIKSINNELRIYNPTDFITPKYTSVRFYLEKEGYFSLTRESSKTYKNSEFQAIELPGIGRLEYLNDITFLNSEIPAFNLSLMKSYEISGETDAIFIVRLK